MELSSAIFKHLVQAEGFINMKVKTKSKTTLIMVMKTNVVLLVFLIVTQARYQGRIFECHRLL